MLAAVSASGVAIFLSLVAGVAGSIQVAVSGAFGKRIGVLEATAFGSLGAALIVCSIVLVARQGFGGVAAGFREPPWLWLNGVMGAIVVLTITFTAPRIGTFATIGLLIAGQLAMGVLIDYLGLFGLDRIPLSAARIIGLLLLAGGAVLVLKRYEGSSITGASASQRAISHPFVRLRMARRPLPSIRATWSPP